MENTTGNYSCKNDDCSMTFTSEDHLIAHVKRHEMVLNLGTIKGSLFNDQTPTPTRFIRNCDEVGLFQDLQNVNPFEETFKRAVEQTKNGSANLTTPLSNIILNDDTLHTPHIFPNFSNIGDCVFHLSKEHSVQLNANCAEEADKNNCDDRIESIENSVKRHKIDTPNVVENESKFMKETKTNLENNSQVCELESGLNINSLKSYDETLTLNVEHVQIDPKENSHTKIISISDGNKIFLPVLEQIQISEKDAKQILTNVHTKSNISSQSKKITNIKEHLKASLLKNAKPSIVKNSLQITSPGILTKVQQVAPIIIANTYPIISSSDNPNLCRILPKNPPKQDGRVFTLSKTNLQKCKTQKTQIIKQKPQIIPQGQDDEQRQEFLARSRAAASRWRVKKKEQIRELINRNQQLENENSWLRSECTQLKKMLLAHKDCPISQAAAGHNITAIGSTIIIPDPQKSADHNIIDANELKNTSCS